MSATRGTVDQPGERPATDPLWRRIDWTTVGFILLVKVFLFGFVYVAFRSLSNRPGDWLGIWSRWDAVHYLNIARDGYVASGEQILTLAFYPLYSWLVRAAAWVLRDDAVAAIFVSGLASLGTGLLLQQLTRRDFGKQAGRLAVWFLFIFPT